MTRLSKFIRRVAVVSLVVTLGLAVKFGLWRWNERQWFALQAQQIETIRCLEQFPPIGWEATAWRNALVTLGNVWGNVTYHPNYSGISHDEMRSLQRELERIVAETTRENAFDSVDRVFQLLLARGRQAEFISGYRGEFREYAKTDG